MPINFLGTGHVPTVEVGTIGQTIPTAGGSVLGADAQGVALTQASLQSAVEHLWQAQMNQNSMFQVMPGQTFQSAYETIYYNTASISPQLSDTDSNTHLTGTNSSMNTKTNTDKPVASKPVTLTLTGQLKPNITIKERPVKSSRSTKKPANPYLAVITATNGW